MVWNNGFLGVVADKEWDTIRAADALKVEWSNAAPPFPSQTTLYDHIRGTPARKREVEGKEAGDVDDAFKSAARVIEAEYEWPFQSHASMGPACSLVEIKDGHVTCWSGTQKSHFVRAGLAAILQMPPDNVHVIWTPGPGSYGRNDADDAAMDAAVLAKAVGKPVRVQYMRNQGTGWDPKGPASIHKARAAIDAAGNVVAYDFLSKGFSRVDVDTNGSKPYDTLAGQTLGVDLKSGDGFGIPAESYGFANKRTAWETIPPLLDRASPLRSSHLRDPVGPQIHFASESFMDEVAAALERRRRRVPAALCERRPRRSRHQGGRGKSRLADAAVAAQGPDRRKRLRPRHRLCTANGTRVAMIAEVDIDRRSGKIHVRKFTVAHDCGQIINPDGIRMAVEGNVVQGISRTLWEEVKFDGKNVTSVDWLTYPILDITETPEQIDVVLINHPEIAPSGAGEPSSRPVAAAIANAVFDATGVRIRRVPFSPDNVKSALS